MTKSLAFVDESRVELKNLLDRTGYTHEYILQKLHENNPKFVKQLGDDKIVKVTAYDISEGKGYCSRVFKTTVHFGKEKTYTFIMKIPTDDAWDKMVDGKFSDDEKEKNKDTISKMHDAECGAYELLEGLKEFPSPEIYHMDRSNSKRPGMIMMNDLSQKGLSLGVFFSITEQHCFNLARHMADFQVYVDFIPGKPWQGNFSENMHGKADIEDIWKKLMLPICDYKEDPELANKAKVFLKLDAAKFGKYATESRAEEIGCKTMVHGDMWTNNMLIEKSEDGSVSDQIMAIIDWQTTFEGSPLFDFARFVTNCADAEIRRGCEREVVNFYYDYLTKKYKEHGEVPKFTREEAHELYELALVQQNVLLFIMFAIMGLPLKDSKNGAERAKLKKLALRAHLLFDDALPLIEKYNLHERFKL